jgi:hypothetical protein
MNMTTVKQLHHAPFRIQSMRAHEHHNSFEDNKAYETFDEAEQAAAAHTHRTKSGNRFIIYQAIAVVGPVPVCEPPCETVLLDELPS